MAILPIYQGPLNGGGFKRGGFPILPFFSFFCPCWDFPDFFGIFPICPGTLWGFSRLVLFLFLGLKNSTYPERVRDTIWTFPERSVGNPPVRKTPGLAPGDPRRAARRPRRTLELQRPLRTLSVARMVTLWNFNFTTDDFPPDSGWEKEILSKENLVLLTKEAEVLETTVGAVFALTRVAL